MDQESSQKIPLEIRAYLEGILEEADVLILSEKDKEDILLDMYAQVNQFLSAKVLTLLPEDQIDTFLQLEEEKKTAEEVEKFMMEHIPDAKDALAKTFDEFSSLYLDTIAIEQARLEAAGQQPDSSNNTDMLKKIAAGDMQS